jgi:hypothetical protein
MINTATLQTLIRHHQEQPIQRGFDDDGLERRNIALKKLQEGVSAVAAEEDAILKDRTLSDEGKGRKRATLAGRVVGNFAWLGQMLVQADQAKMRLQEVLYGPITEQSKRDAVVQQLRDQEVRQDVRGLDINQRNAHFLTALESDQLEVVRAMLDAPTGPMISPDVLERGKTAYATRTAPETFEQLGFVEHLREHLGALSESTAQWLRHLGASPEAIQKAVKAKD